MNYNEFTQWAQDVINALPIYYAFGEKQFNEMLAAHFGGISETQAPALLYATNAGGYYLKTDAERINNAFKSIAAKQDELINADKDGTGFIYEMFLTELNDHEYIITRDIETTLDAAGITPEDLQNNPALHNGLKRAIATIEQSEN